MNGLKRNLLKLVLIVATVLITTITMINLPGMSKEVKASEGTTTNGLKYRIDDEGVTITGYVGKSTKVNIPEKIDGKSVTSIGFGAFSGCSSLTSISIPSSVTEIYWYAFSGCSSLTNISIPSSVTSIGESAFGDCSSLTSIRIPSSVTSIEGFAFDGCSSLTSISIPSSVTEIGYHAFGGCSSLSKIRVSASNKYYDSRNNCNAIIETASNKLIAGCKNTSIPSSVTEIGEYAFDGCSSLTSISIPSSVTEIGKGAFSGCSSLTSINIPSSVTEIGEYTFDGCSSLTSISIPSSVTSIGLVAFSECSSLTSISIPSSVTSIGEFAFDYCSSLTSISIPSSVTEIGYHAFTYCSSLTSISIPSSVTYIGAGVFYGCSSLTKISVSASNKYYDSRNNCNAIIETASNKLIAGCKNTSIPSSVTSIGEGAFGGFSSLTSISIPSSVTSIGFGAFSFCSSLTSISIPSSVTGIGSDAFRECSKLTIYCPANSYAEKYAIEEKIKHNIPELKSKPSINSITNTTSGIKLTWSKNSKAKGYIIYRSINGAAYTKIKTITGNTKVSYTDTKATTNGAKYQYKIVAYKSVSGTTYKSAYSSVKTIYRLSKPTISSASNTSAGKVTVKWNKNSKATGYQIKYVVGTTTKTKMITGATNISKVISRLTKGKTYKIYVRSYKMVGTTKYFSNWSSCKRVKITK